MKRLFFYGSLRRDEYNHQRFAKYLTHVADGHIKGAELIGGNGYPWVVPTTNDSNIVLGEVYDMDDKLFELIEAMELGAGYKRKQVEVEIVVHGPEHDIDDVIDAEAYFYTQPADLDGLPRIASGDWTTRDKETNS